MRKKKYFGKRAMLNLPGYQNTAAIVAEIEDSSTWRKGRNGNDYLMKNKYDAGIYANLTISDCTRSVSLSLDMNREDDYQNSLYKVDTLIEALSGLRMGMVIEHDRHVERIKDFSDVEDD